MPYLEVNSLPLYYEIHGSGEDLVLLHHGFGSSKIWHDIMPALVETGFRVTMFDRRGYGGSEPGPEFDRYFTREDFASACVSEMEEVLEKLAIREFHLIGQCEGGVIACHFAAAHPGAVRSLVAASAQCYSTMPMREFNILKFPKPFREMDEDFRRKMVYWHGEDKAEYLFDLFRIIGGAYGHGWFDLREQLAAVSCPALVIYPDRSGLFDVDQGVAFYKSLPDGELAVMPSCGHNTYDQRPEEYLRLIRDFYIRRGFL